MHSGQSVILTDNMVGSMFQEYRLLSVGSSHLSESSDLVLYRRPQRGTHTVKVKKAHKRKSLKYLDTPVLHELHIHEKLGLKGNSFLHRGMSAFHQHHLQNIIPERSLSVYNVSLSPIFLTWSSNLPSLFAIKYYKQLKTFIYHRIH